MQKLLLTISATFISVFLLSQEKSVLFIGNSYTSGMPTVIKSIAENMGDNLYYESHNPGGTRLMTHAGNTTVHNLIKSRQWDYVSVQAQSQEPSWSNWQVEQEVYPYAAQLSDSIKANYHCSLPLFYMTWGRENGDVDNCLFVDSVCTYEGMDNQLRKNYTRMARENEAVVAPAGKVWRHLRDNNPTIDLYSADGSHPNTIGRYANAVTFYTMIFQKDPTLITFDGGINADDAIIIREAVKAVVYNQMASYHFGVTYPTSDYVAYCQDPGFTCDNPETAQLGVNDFYAKYGGKWFEFTADSTTDYTIRTCGLTLTTDGWIALYDDCNNQITYNDDYQGGGSCSFISFEGIKGHTYLINSDVWEASMDKVFPFSIEYSSVDSSLIQETQIQEDCQLAEVFEPGYYQVNFNQNGWGMFIAPDSGTVTISSCGLTYTDTYLTIGRPMTECNQWISEEIAESDDDCSNWVESYLEHQMHAGDTIMFKWWDEFGHDDFVYQISFDNWVEEEEVTSISSFKESFSLYPNPSTGIVHVINDKEEVINVYDIQGELIISTTNNVIDLSEYPSGIYFFQKNGISQKVIKK